MLVCSLHVLKFYNTHTLSVILKYCTTCTIKIVFIIKNTYNCVVRPINACKREFSYRLFRNWSELNVGNGKTKHKISSPLRYHKAGLGSLNLTFKFHETFNRDNVKIIRMHTQTSRVSNLGRGRQVCWNAKFHNYAILYMHIQYTWLLHICRFPVCELMMPFLSGETLQ